ncbi:unnamed protein product [Caenorhabditis auriculariae]|uniref:Uncharacterized protein n=1 Tax=Caenorhabditis auriculariae TaxID=2777116 RepID=A0A8S1HAZ2_9PELO|nr:unnamed protein product [Caenorhabditis auriculariae]
MKKIKKYPCNGSTGSFLITNRCAKVFAATKMTEPREVLMMCVQVGVQLAIGSVVASAIIGCSGKKSSTGSEGSQITGGPSAGGTKAPTGRNDAQTPTGDEGGDKAAGGGPKAPAQGGVAGTHDPNYQTLAGIGNDCFQNKPAAGGGGGGFAAAAAGPRAPAQGGIAGTHDPNYQTLAGIGNDCFAGKPAGGGAAPAAGAGPKAPAAGGVAGESLLTASC